MFHTISWCSRPALPLLLFTCLFLIVSPIAGYTYDYSTIRQKRSPNEDTKVSNDFEANLDRIFKFGSDSGLVLFNETSQSAQKDVMFKVQRSPDGKLNVIFNDFLIFQTTTAGTLTNINYNNDQNTHHNNRNNDAIIFSDDGYICSERLKGKPYCLDVPNYLESSRLDTIDEDNFDKFKSYFKDDVVPPPDITQRMNSGPQDEYYCSSTSHLIYPKSAETKESKWLLVVQHENHKQGILVEQCDNEEKPCRFQELLPKFYTSRCKQNYIYRTMVVSVDGKLREEQVKMPSCCKCVLRNSQT
ncbi:protein spaetzle isoform X1 [Bactrocera oleae]|uniref:protein spaetzle isoform X1 n=1 Tax=Bactrocera oleae TaxID=104688 RepID=UPI00387E829E